MNHVAACATNIIGGCCVKHVALCEERYQELLCYPCYLLVRRTLYVAAMKHAARRTLLGAVVKHVAASPTNVLGGCCVKHAAVVKQTLLPHPPKCPNARMPECRNAPCLYVAEKEQQYWRFRGAAKGQTASSVSLRQCYEKLSLLTGQLLGPRSERP